MGLTVFSYGGGVQSNAALVLAALGELRCDVFLFANVGDDSEHPETLRYVREVAMPFARAQGVQLVELRRRRRTGEAETLYERMRKSRLDIPIPVRLGRSGVPARRSCTKNFKVDVINKWLREHGATAQEPATVMLGISLDEFQRMNQSRVNYTVLAYPLIDLRMTRQDCMNVIRSAGLPIPPKSSCWFCPFHSLTAWRELRERTPDLFDRAVELEAHLNVIAGKRGDHVWMTRKLKPLPMAIGDASQPSLFESDACESGYCMV